MKARVSTILANAPTEELLTRGFEAVSLPPSCIVPPSEAPQCSEGQPREDRQTWCSPFYSSLGILELSVQLVCSLHFLALVKQLDSAVGIQPAA